MHAYSWGTLSSGGRKVTWMNTQQLRTIRNIRTKGQRFLPRAILAMGAGGLMWLTPEDLALGTSPSLLGLAARCFIMYTMC